MCERYLLRKNLMKTMAQYQEMKKAKQVAYMGSTVSEDKATFQDSDMTPGEPIMPQDRLNLLD